MANKWSTWKEPQCNQSAGKSKLKPQWCSPTHLSEWLQSKTLVISSSSPREQAELLEVSCYLVSESSLTISYKVQYILRIWPSSPIPRDLPQISYVHLKTCTWMCIAAFFITVKNHEQPECFARREWVSKPQTSYNGALLSNKRENSRSTQQHKGISR